ncbi:MAG: hypothetical protein JOZ25_03350 [Actinobacteria bacterium]|nr:hypothetical protein [Actinomycetota bacterium]
MPLTPEQRRTRDRVETVIRLIAPGLNLVLAAGERLSRVVSREDDDYYPIRPATVPPNAQPEQPPAQD